MSHLAEAPLSVWRQAGLADFGLWGQFYELWTDPTAGALIEGSAPNVLDWVHRMLWPGPKARSRHGPRWRRP